MFVFKHNNWIIQLDYKSNELTISKVEDNKAIDYIYLQGEILNQLLFDCPNKKDFVEYIVEEFKLT